MSLSPRFSRIDHEGTRSKWIVAVPAGYNEQSKGDLEFSRIEVPRKNGQLARITLGRYLCQHPKLQGYNCFAIDRNGYGSKAPTGGDMGENKDGRGSQPRTPFGGDLQAPDTPVQVQPETLVNLNQYALKVDVHAAIEQVRAEVEDQKPVLINLAPLPDQPDFQPVKGVAHAALCDVLICVAGGIHPYLVGPAGTGKTHLAGQVADTLGKELAICGAMLTKHEVTGYQNASGEYVTTAAREAFEHGKILLWDEVDSSSPAALVAVNAMLANDRYTFPDKTVNRHPDFVCIAAGNTYGTGADREYVGRVQLDAATLDRFAFIEIGYDLKVEAAITRANYMQHGGDDPSTLDKWLTSVVAVRDLIREKSIRHIVSPRAAVNGAILLARGMAHETVVKMVLIKGVSADVEVQLRSAI